MITVDEKNLPTIADAAKEFGVRPKTVREWIEKGIIPRPPSVDYGLRTVNVFSPEFMKAAKQKLKEHRQEKNRQRPRP